MTWEDLFVTYEPEHVKVRLSVPRKNLHWHVFAYKLILATDFPNFIKGRPKQIGYSYYSYNPTGPKFDHAMSSVLGTGVFNSGLSWPYVIYYAIHSASR